MHIPVLLKESLEYLNPKSGDIIVDGTLNGGGHAEKILEAIGASGKLVGIEQDGDILNNLKKRIQEGGLAVWENAILINDNFRNLDKILESLKIKKINGAIFDLGFSSMQLESSGRGFSFQKDEPLMMTLKSNITPEDITAETILNTFGEEEMADLIYKYGEERYSRRIARNIVWRREQKKIATTFELVDIIREAVPAVYRNNRRINCATRTFQALRIAVNDELGALGEGLAKAWERLDGGGRLVAISFHSLEDRIVKNFFKEKHNLDGGKILTKKPTEASEGEKSLNPRSRSAKLRALEKNNDQNH